MSLARTLSAVALFALLGLTGCSTARYVYQDEHGGVVAIPANLDVWPFQYRRQAEELMAKKCPSGYVIEREEEVVVGQVVTGHDTTDTQTQELPGGKRLPGATLTNTSTTHTTQTQDRTEYRITFRAKPAN